MKTLALLASPFVLTGCLSNPPQMPILTCAGECTYYGEPQENPNVAMARVLTGGATKIAGLVMNGQVLKKALDAKNYIAPAAGASKEVYKEIMSDRVTNNSVTDRDHSCLQLELVLIQGNLKQLLLLA
jgi:hypothetical protein